MPAIASERHVEHVGETAGMADHDRDLVHELSKRLDSLWRCDQFIANAKGHDDVIRFWKDIKQQELDNIDRLRGLVKGEIRNECF